ncbi:MAG: gamma-glutamylcyclotransferase family protein [Fodinibius sp.]|nr:gamma-glutamylcyclotransferase family protein [Fodinibius sp.]
MAKLWFDPFGNEAPWPISYKNTAIISERLSMPGKLYDSGSFPAAIYQKNATTIVHGNLHAIVDSSALFQQLDRYEGYNPGEPTDSLFVRKVISVNYDNESAIASTYLYNHPTNKLNWIRSGRLPDLPTQ